TPADICLLQTGDVVPADLRLLEAAELTIDEAALTGEAFPAEKEAGATHGTAGSIQDNCAYMGTIVRSGRGAGVVALTGMATRLLNRIVALECLGDADLLVTGQTGTLAVGEIGPRAAAAPAGAPAPERIRLGLLCSELSFEHGGRPVGNTLDLASWRALEPGV